LFRCRPFPPTKNFIVFFDFTRSNLAADALAILQDAVKTSKSDEVAVAKNRAVRRRSARSTSLAAP
jgi:hypothetical protein